MLSNGSRSGNNVTAEAVHPAKIALARVFYPALRRYPYTHQNPGSLVEPCAKIGVTWAGGTDGIDVGSGFLMDGQRVYRRVPDIIRGKNGATAGGLGRGGDQEIGPQERDHSTRHLYP